MNVTRELFDEVWQKTKSSYISSEKKPKAYVLGGQPGSGKSYLIEQVKKELNNNAIIINGDDFRRFHPDYKKIQKEYGKDSPKVTAQFAGKMTEAVLEKAISENYNIIIEGTFRTFETPLETLQKLKNANYETNVYIKAISKHQSWKNCLERYEKMLELDPEEARYTDKFHHDLIVNNLAQNVEMVSNSSYVDNLKVFNVNSKIYDMNTDKIKNLKLIIENELNKNIMLIKESKLQTFRLKNKPKNKDIER